MGEQNKKRPNTTKKAAFPRHDQTKRINVIYIRSCAQSALVHVGVCGIGDNGWKFSDLYGILMMDTFYNKSIDKFVVLLYNIYLDQANASYNI